MRWMGPGSQSRRTLAAAGALVVCAGMLSGCGDDPPPPQAAVLESGDQYVALGDSYTAAPGTGPETSNDGCLQSAVNYPHQVAEELELELTDVSCGGATTADLAEGQPLPPKPPQLAALSEETALVTLRIGGNDSQLFARTTGKCAELANSDAGSGSPCSDSFGGRDFLVEATDRIRADVVAALGEIEERAPDARVVVVGYPAWAPPSPAGRCDQLPLAPGDYAYARQGNELLVAALRDAATEAGVEYVDVWSVAEQHHICADDPWIAGLRPTAPAAPLHPYSAEQQAAAELLVDLLGGDLPGEVGSDS